MLTAINSEGRKVLAPSAEKRDDFKCESCGESLILRKGLKRVHHFAHNSGSQCVHKGESQVHLAAKNSIFICLSESLKDRVRSIELEKHLGNIRPDVFIEGYKKAIAIEIQASQFTVKELIERTVKYFEKDIYVLWLLPFEEKRLVRHRDREGNTWFEFRLKEYEKALYYMYYKNLIFWNEEKSNIMILKFRDIYGADSSFYNEFGEEQYFSGKKLKNLKGVRSIKKGLSIESFSPSFAKRFKMPGGHYVLPNRKIMVYMNS